MFRLLRANVQKQQHWSGPQTYFGGQQLQNSRSWYINVFLGSPMYRLSIISSSVFPQISAKSSISLILLYFLCSSASEEAGTPMLSLSYRLLWKKTTQIEKYISCFELNYHWIPAQIASIPTLAIHSHSKNTDDKILKKNPKF